MVIGSQAAGFSTDRTEPAMWNFRGRIFTSCALNAFVYFVRVSDFTWALYVCLFTYNSETGGAARSLHYTRVQKAGALGGRKAGQGWLRYARLGGQNG